MVSNLPLHLEGDVLYNPDFVNIFFYPNKCEFFFFFLVISLPPFRACKSASLLYDIGILLLVSVLQLEI